MKTKKKTPRQDIFDVESLLIPENLIRSSMKTKELDRYLKTLFKKHESILVYRYNGVRYIFMDDEFVIEEVLK